MDPDQDLLDELDRREAGRLYFILALIGFLAMIAGIVAYLALSLTLHARRDVAFDSAVLVFIGSAVLLSSHCYRFR
jgi:hypothetical protein